MPRRLGRNMAAFFMVMITAPMAIGLTFWAATDGTLPSWWVSCLVKPLVITGESSGYSGFGNWAGCLLALIGVIGLTKIMLKQLPTGGRIATFFTMVPLSIYALYIAFAGASLPIPQLADDANALQDTIHLLTTIFWSPLTHDIMVPLGWGVAWAGVVVVIIFCVWRVGGAIGMPRILTCLMYVVFLPLFLSPFVFKHDMYVLSGVPGLHDYAWLITILLALPGTLYLLLRRPKDEFGYEVSTNPWHANTLDWTATTSPPAYLNFDKIPTVYRGPYEYSSPVVQKDYLPQDEQLPEGVVEPTGH